MEGSEAVGFSHSEFGLVVEALNDAAGELLFGMEIVPRTCARAGTPTRACRARTLRLPPLPLQATATCITVPPRYGGYLPLHRRNTCGCTVRRMSGRCERGDLAIFFIGSMRERHDLTAPLIEELASPGRRFILPELLEILLQQIELARSAGCNAAGRAGGSVDVRLGRACASAHTNGTFSR